MKTFLTLMMGLFMGCGGLSSAGRPEAGRSPGLLVFSRTVGFRHDSIPAAAACLKRFADKNGWNVLFTEDPAAFTPENLARFDVAVFLMTRGDALGPAEEAAFRDFIRSGKGFVGIHTATITENDWPWCVELAGGKFIGHPPVQEGRVVIEDREHPAVPASLGAEWIRVDEWYSFDRNPRAAARVLMSVDESSYDFGDKAGETGSKLRMGDHPIVWCREYDGGRVFQTALGHGDECYEDALFVAHLEGAILWAAGREAK